MPEDRAIGRVAVTGASGFVGRNLVRVLAARQIPVKALGRDRNRLPRIFGVEPVECGLSDCEALHAAFSDVDTVIHAAALVGGITSGEAVMQEANVIGTRNIVRSAQASGRVSRLIHVSTVGVMGLIDTGRPILEDDRPSPRSIYGRTKLAAEKEILSADVSFERIIVRPMWIYGPDSPSTEKLIGNILRRRMVLIGASNNLIQPVYIDDMTESLLKCATVSGLRNEVIQVAGPEAITTEQMCRDVADVTGAPPPRLRLPLWLARAAATLLESVSAGSGRKLPLDNDKIDFFRVHHQYSLDRAKHLLDWQPRTSFREGIAQTVAHLRSR